MDNEVLKRTLHNKVTVVIIVLFMLLLIGCGVMSFRIYQGTSKSQKYFVSDAKSIYGDLLTEQSKINNRLNKISNDSNYTLANAYIELDPYKISPLSGIIIFQTKNDEQIRLYINDKYVSTIEASKKHIIPIYGLYENYDNVVRIESINDTKEYIFKTGKINIDNYKKATKDILFDTSSKITGYDDDSKVRFYLSREFTNNIVWLSNGHFLTGIKDGSVNNQHVSFVEMDYLGKIYNHVTLSNGFSTLNTLSNGDIILLGMKDNKNYIYTIDSRTGNTISSMDMYSIIKDIDSTFNDDYLNNSITYDYINYLDDKVYVSNKDVIWCFNYKTQKLINVYTTNKTLFSNAIWKDYLVDTIDVNNDLINTLYDELNNNIQLSTLNIINNIPLSIIKESNYKKINLDDSDLWNNTIELTNSLLLSDYDFHNKNVQIYLVNRAGKVFIIDYKNKAFNISLSSGQYVLFIKVDDVLYKTNKVYQF